MILFVAPYSPGFHLGAARKIEMMLSCLVRMGEQVVLINSSHRSHPGPIESSMRRIGDVDVLEVLPPRYATARFGKLRNLIDVRAVVRYLESLPNPSLIWIYNSYAFECLMARELNIRFGAPILLELEDAVFSRGRGLNPKPYVDWLAALAIRRKIAHTICVNGVLASRCAGPKTLLPGFIKRRSSSWRIPFSRDVVRVGYFGGLSREKGADLVLALGPLLPAAFELVVTGVGELAEQFRSSAATCSQMDFRGAVSNTELEELIGQCDIILNPHRPVLGFHDGIFPFKVLEAVGSGRLVISTDLPRSGLEDVLASVVFVPPRTEAFLHAIVSAKFSYSVAGEAILRAADEVAARFGEDTVRKTVRSVKRLGIAQ